MYVVCVVLIIMDCFSVVPCLWYYVHCSYSYCVVSHVMRRLSVRICLIVFVFVCVMFITRVRFTCCLMCCLRVSMFHVLFCCVSYCSSYV